MPLSTPSHPANHDLQRKRRRTGSYSSIGSNRSSAENSNRAVTTPPSDIGSQLADAADGDGDEEESYTKEAEAEDEGDLDDEDAQLFATQREERRNRDHSDECGILESVEIINFMCHKHYMFKLGPRINFICGKNGSGKSAILTAIILCLGGKASQTNRASSLKDLIRQGQDQGSITCRVKNVGDNSYAHDEYGESIIIERHFSRSGTAGFKLKNDRGRIVSTKKADLEAICDHFGFQVENPMSVLSQDLARQFITSSSASEKYRLFVKGVLLEQLDQDYCIIEQNVSTFQPRIEDAKKDLTDLKNNAEAAKNKAEQGERFEGMRATFRDWRRALAWEQVRLREEDRNTYEREIHTADEKIAAAQTHVEELDGAFQEATVTRDAAKQAWDQAEAEVQSVKDQKKEEDAKYKDAKKEVSEGQADQRNVKTLLSDAVKTIETKKTEIEAEMTRLAELDGGGAAQRLRQLQEAERAVTDAKEEAEAYAETREPLKVKAEEAARALTKAQEKVSIQEDEVRKQSERLEKIRKEGGVQDSAYHPNMPQLLKAIAQEKRFQTRPIGPIGRHIKLLHPEWSSILEKSFGGTLNGFVVTSKSDQNILSSIIKRIIPRGVGVFIATSGVIDTRGTEPDEGFLTIDRALEIDSPLVRKVLVIQHYIDNTGLIRDHAEASRTLFPESGPRPRNLLRCCCFHPRSRTSGFHLHTKGGRPAQDPISQWQGDPRMRSNVEDQIRIQQSVLDEAKEQLLDLESDMRSCRTTHEKAKQENARFKKRSLELRVAVQKAEELVDELNDAIKDDNVKSGNVDVLRQALAEAEQQKGLHEGSFMDATASLDEKKKSMKDIQKKLSEFDVRIGELSTVASQRKSEAQKADKNREHTLREKNAAVARVDDGRNDRNTMNQKMTQIMQLVEDATTAARGVSERVNFPEGETFESLTVKYARMRQELQNAQKKLGGSHEQLEAEKARTATTYVQAKGHVDELELLTGGLTGTMHNRRARWRQFQRFITVAAKFNFGHLLGERGFRGRLLLDHKQHLLDLKVEPDVTKKSGKGRNANTLSGGEKSFSQICLLLAIWEAMGSPVRCLDEFDVFMDAVNRNRSASLLIEGARNSTGKQFILISPGSKEDIPIAPDVRRIE